MRTLNCRCNQGQYLIKGGEGMVGREAVGPPPKVELALLERHEARRWEESRPGKKIAYKKKIIFCELDIFSRNSSVVY
jgi:hypothetical protein